VQEAVVRIRTVLDKNANGQEDVSDVPAAARVDIFGTSMANPTCATGIVATNGLVEIRNLAPGEYQVMVWWNGGFFLGNGRVITADVQSIPISIPSSHYAPIEPRTVMLALVEVGKAEIPAKTFTSPLPPCVTSR
jgi:hypothetical protein